jgi:hypothetical protein
MWAATNRLPAASRAIGQSVWEHEFMAIGLEHDPPCRMVEIVPPTTARRMRMLPGSAM